MKTRKTDTQPKRIEQPLPYRGPGAGESLDHPIEGRSTVSDVALCRQLEVDSATDEILVARLAERGIATEYFEYPLDDGEIVRGIRHRQADTRAVETLLESVQEEQRGAAGS